jgi:signal transduction histidine kinase
MEVMEEFMSIAGHELRAPLAGAMMSMELAHHQLQAAQDQHGNHPTHMEAIAESLELLANTREQLGRQQRLVADLLDVARIQSGGFAMNLQLTDVVALVVESVRETHRIEPSRAITVELPVTPISEVMIDPDRLRQVLSNYLSNAIRYSPPSTAIHVRMGATDSALMVEVRDEGPGVPVDQQRRIWERYQRVSDLATQAGSPAGLGLGLYISRNIIERHGGDVGLESSSGQGTTFWFTLPCDVPTRHTLAPDPRKLE